MLECVALTFTLNCFLHSVRLVAFVIFRAAVPDAPAMDAPPPEAPPIDEPIFVYVVTVFMHASSVKRHPPASTVVVFWLNTMACLGSSLLV